MSSPFEAVKFPVFTVENNTICIDGKPINTATDIKLHRSATSDHIEIEVRFVSDVVLKFTAIDGLFSEVTPTAKSETAKES